MKAVLLHEVCQCFPTHSERGPWAVREHDELLKEAIPAPKCAMVSDPLTSMTLQVISWKAHFLSKRDFLPLLPKKEKRQDKKS